MAIDNAEKRKSISGIGLQPFVAPGVTPNVGKDTQWRTQVAWSYSGFIPDPGGGGSDDTATCGVIQSTNLGGFHLAAGSPIDLN